MVKAVEWNKLMTKSLEAQIESRGHKPLQSAIKNKLDNFFFFKPDLQSKLNIFDSHSETHWTWREYPDSSQGEQKEESLISSTHLAVAWYILALLYFCT